MRNFLKFSVFAICISSSAFLSAETLYYDNAVYDGEVVNGKRHGQGSIEYTSGHKYKGGWFLDTQKGKGTLTLAFKVHNGAIEKVRLADIDTPERDQPWGTEATTALRQ